MAKIPGWLGGKIKAKKPRLGSRIHYAQGRGDQIIVQGNPHPHEMSRPQSAWVFDFTCIAQWTKRPDPRAFEQASYLTDDTGWYYRDMLHSAMSGKLIGALEERITTPTARVRRTTAQALVNGTALILTPNEKAWDNNFFWNPETLSTRLTVRSKGLYLVHSNVHFSGVTANNRWSGLKVNGATEIGDMATPVSNNSPPRHQVTELWYFDEMDYIEAWAYANAAGVTAQLAAFWILAITPESVLS